MVVVVAAVVVIVVSWRWIGTTHMVGQLLELVYAILHVQGLGLYVGQVPDSEAGTNGA